MSNAELSPAALANLDQWYSTLDQLVDMAARHRALQCPLPPYVACIGQPAATLMQALPRDQIERLVDFAVTRLVNAKLAG